ncbi:MAG: transcription antitermination factor NusB [Candidatus Aminicenantales bacterium]
MGKRRKAREATLQILFQLDFNSSELTQTINHYWQDRKAFPGIREYSQWLVEGIISNQKEIDRIIQSFSKHWRLSRMAVVDRNILRMAVFELLYEKNVAPAIIINEAIEIAKKYSGQEAAVFINGILDAISKKLDSVKETMGERKNE